MKLTREATTAANPDLRGRKHHFIIESATAAELEAMGDRWRVVPHLLKGEPYRDIHDSTKVSVTTIGRVARCIERGAGGYQAAARRLQLTAVSNTN